MAHADVEGRAIGQYPISIATSLAIESAFGIHPEIKVDKPPINDHDELWVNLRTLFRNLVGAIDKDALATVKSVELKTAMLGELQMIEQLVVEQTQGRVRVVYYISDYADIEKHYPYATVRRDNTPRQKEYTDLLKRVVTEMLKELPPNYVRTFSLKLVARADQPMELNRMKASKVLILTHHPYDLLSYKNFGALTLLESHTGAVKDRSQWYTKYYQGKELSMIPFREDLIQIFGDNETFRTHDPKIRRDIIEIAKKYKWSSVTTYDKLKYGIDTMKNPFALAILHKIMSARY